VTGRRGRRRKELLYDLKEKRRYGKLKKEALDRTVWRTRFGRGYGPVVRQTAECMNERGSTRSHCVENLLWKRLWTCRKTDYRMNERPVRSLPLDPS
jgi:hypothetical protein